MTGWFGGSNPSLATTARVGVTVISPGPQPGDCRFKSGTRHPWPHRLLARIRPLQGREDGSEPSGAANLAWPNWQGSGPLIRHVKVRLLPREPWSCRGDGVPATPSKWRSRVQVPSGPLLVLRAPMVKRRSCQSTKLVVEVRVLLGARRLG